MRHLAVSLVVLLFVLTFSPRPHAAQTPATVAELYAAFAAGRPDGIYQAFRAATDFRAARGELFQFARATGTDWRPSRAAFLIHLIHIGADRGWTDAPLLLTTARDIVIQRPSPVGANEAEDAFEIEWHRTAVGIMMGSRDLTRAAAYLTTLAGRVSAAPVPDRKVLIDPRLPLMRGLITELSLAPFVDQPLPRPDMLPSLLFDPRNGFVKTRAELALSAYTQATDPTVAAEAGIRSAFLLHRLGRHSEARDRLRTIVVPLGEPSMAYLKALFMGRVEEALASPADAIAAYEAAAALVPGAQTPAVALASLYQRQDRPAEALRWAAAATSMPLDTPDPWWRYWSGDYWRVPAWLADLRRMQP